MHVDMACHHGTVHRRQGGSQTSALGQTSLAIAAFPRPNTSHTAHRWSRVWERVTTCMVYRGRLGPCTRYWFSGMQHASRYVHQHLIGGLLIPHALAPSESKSNTCLIPHAQLTLTYRSMYTYLQLVQLCWLQANYLRQLPVVLVTGK